MIRNHFKIALRNLVKHKLQSFLSVFGLMIGLGISILIILFVNDEFSYDAYHMKADRIFRLANNWQGGDDVTPWARTSTPMGPAIKAGFPQVEQVVRIRKNPRTDLLEYGENKFYEDGLIFADKEVLDVFDFPLLRGNRETVLSNKFSLLITEDIARKYFGDEDPVGKILTYDNQFNLTVTGILGKIPSNSHFHFDMMADFETAKEILGEQRYKNWFWFDIQTYLLLRKGEDIKTLEATLNNIIEKNIPERYAPMFDLFLQPLTSIHLQSNLKDELEKNSDAKYSYIMITVAGFIMIMACINFMNLTTANYTTRLTEIGIRKVFGARRSQLIRQYLTESVLMTLMAFILSTLLVALTLPSFNELTEKEISLLSPDNFNIYGLVVLFIILTGVIAGSYPALYLSSLSPALVIKGNTTPGKGVAWFRDLLVTLQISISLVMICSTLIVNGQLSYFNQTTFGFDKEYIVIVPIKDRVKNAQHEQLVNRFVSSPHVINATFSSSIPGSNDAMSFYFKAASSEKDAQVIPTYLIDDNFLKTFNLDVLEGEDLAIDRREDSIGYAIVNESFVRFFDIEEPVGTFIVGNGSNKVIKVVKDFNIKSLHHDLEPVILIYGTNWFRHIAVKINGSNIPAALDHLATEYTNFYTGYPFDYNFLDDTIGKQYQTEQKLSTLFKFFSGVAILIAGLGLIGLAAYMVNQRIREVGIRKVLGSSIGQVVALFSKHFIYLLIIATILSFPITYYLMNEWLSSFAYRISISIDFFATAMLIVVITLFCTIGFQIHRAAMMNPVDTLRYE